MAPKDPESVTMYQKPKGLALEDGSSARMYPIERSAVSRFRGRQAEGKKGAPKMLSEAGMLLKRKDRRSHKIGTCDDVDEKSGS